MHDVVGKLLELFEFLYGIAPSISFGPSHRDCSPSVTGRSEYHNLNNTAPWE